MIGEFTPRGPLAGGSETTAGRTLKDYFPAAIDATTFWKARSALKARASSNVRLSAGKHRNVLSGLLKCGVCGGGMHYINKGSGKKAGKPFLQCGSSLLKGGCQHTSRYVYEAVEGHVLMNLSSSTRHKDAEQDNISALKAACNEAEGKLNRMLDLVERGIGGDLSIQRAAMADEELAESRKALAMAIEKEEFGKANSDLRTGFREMALTALRLRENPNDTQLRADTANMLRNVVKLVALSPGRISLSYPWSDDDAIRWTMRSTFAEEVTSQLLRFAGRHQLSELPIASARRRALDLS